MLFVCEIVQGILQVESERFGIVMMFLLFLALEFKICGKLAQLNCY